MFLSVFFFRGAPELGLEGKLRVGEVSRNVTNVPFCFLAPELGLESKLRVGRVSRNVTNVPSCFFL